ncbi:hypothetical protein [Plesiomonas sp. ZOR0011]|uniref:hypothetical protein n=1 Tax=Plesiomonas sp. ZOR0011 TaxID=1339230 RepID=UPI0006461934|nr:hypothetical protein [Plesiomonas sp. ZOR0011]
MNNTFLKAACLALSLAVAALSGWLTVSFMFSIGQAVGAPFTTAAIGGILDLTKCLSPAFVILFLAKRRYASFLFALLLSLSLSLVSFAASVASLESGIVASQQNSAAHQRIAQQIELYTVQVNELRNLAALQQSAKQVTKSQSTLSQANVLLSKIDSLSAQQASTNTETTVDRYGMFISYIAAAALELTSWLLVLVASTLRHTQAHLNTVEINQCDEGACSPETVLIPVSTGNINDTLNAHSDTPAMNDCVFEKADCVDIADCVELDKCTEQLCLEIKQAILSQAVKPSHRGITAAFGSVGRDVINHVLTELSNTGLLRPYRNGYALAI